MLTPNSKILGKTIDLWNRDSEELRKNPQVSSVVARSLVQSLGIYFHNYSDTCDLYMFKLEEATKIMGLAENRSRYDQE